MQPANLTPAVSPLTAAEMLDFAMDPQAAMTIAHAAATKASLRMGATRIVRAGISARALQGGKRRFPLL
jgi:hypothetical protein